MGRGHEKMYLQEDIQMANRHEKLFNIIKNRGYENQNHSERPPHTS